MIHLNSINHIFGSLNIRATQLNSILNVIERSLSDDILQEFYLKLPGEKYYRLDEWATNLFSENILYELNISIFYGCQ